jgi:hypothetical protein
MSAGPTLAMLIFVGPGVKVKSVKCDTLSADWYFRKTRPYFGIEPVSVHTEVTRRISKAYEAW